MTIESTPISELQAESGRIEVSIGKIESQLGDFRARLQMIRSEIAKRLRPAPEPRLSDHALLRYLERIKGVDVASARAEIMTPTVIASIKAKASAVVVNGARFVVKDNCLVTITDDDKKPRQRFQNGRPDTDEIAEHFARAD